MSSIIPHLRVSDGVQCGAVRHRICVSTHSGIAFIWNVSWCSRLHSRFKRGYAMVLNVPGSNPGGDDNNDGAPEKINRLI